MSKPRTPEEDDERDPRLYPPDMPLHRVDPAKVVVSGYGHFNGEWRKRRNAIIDALLIAGILALVTATLALMRTSDKLETAFTERSVRYDGEITRIENTLTRHDERLDSLEQQRWEPDTHHKRR